MDEETLNKLVGRLTAHERVLTLLLGAHLKGLAPGDLAFFEAVIESPAPPPRADDVSSADHLAGRTIVYRESIARILGAAQEIAGL